MVDSVQTSTTMCNLVNKESTSARALEECIRACSNVNLNEEESSGNTSSHGEATTKEADLKNLLQLLGVTEVDAVVDEEENNQLHLAARDGKTEIVESLLIHGAKKDVQNNWGKTALHLAAERGHNAIVQMLLEHGFDPNARDDYRNNPLYLVCCNEYDNDANTIEILLNFGAEINKPNNYGDTPLHIACYTDHSTALVKSLLENGASLRAQDICGDTPLHNAIARNKEEVVLMLLQHGASLHMQNRQREDALEFAKKI